MRIHHVTLIVNDLQAAGDFYVKRLGLHVRDPGPIDYPGAFLVINDEQELHLAEFADKPPSFRGHFCLRVANWSDLYRTFRDEGLLDLQPWGKVRELPGGVLQCYVRDPSGNLVELTSRPEDRGRIDPLEEPT